MSPPQTNAAVCTAIEVHGAFHPAPSPKPALVISLELDDGTTVGPFVLALEEDAMATVGPLIGVQAHRAIAVARSVRGLS